MNINRFVLVSSIEIINIAALLCDCCHANSVQLGIFSLNILFPCLLTQKPILCETQDLHRPKRIRRREKLFPALKGFETFIFVWNQLILSHQAKQSKVEWILDTSLPLFV